MAHVLSFQKYTPHPTLAASGGSVGPEVVAARSDIVAIEAGYHDGKSGSWRSVIHLRGGTTLLVADDFEDVKRRVYADEPMVPDFERKL